MLYCPYIYFLSEKLDCASLKFIMYIVEITTIKVVIRVCTVKHLTVIFANKNLFFGLNKLILWIYI